VPSFQDEYDDLIEAERALDQYDNLMQRAAGLQPKSDGGADPKAPKDPKEANRFSSEAPLPHRAVDYAAHSIANISLGGINFVGRGMEGLGKQQQHESDTQGIWRHPSLSKLEKARRFLAIHGPGLSAINATGAGRALERAGQATSGFADPLIDRSTLAGEVTEALGSLAAFPVAPFAEYLETYERNMAVTGDPKKAHAAGSPVLIVNTAWEALGLGTMFRTARRISRIGKPGLRQAVAATAQVARSIGTEAGTEFMQEVTHNAAEMFYDSVNDKFDRDGFFKAVRNAPHAALIGGFVGGIAPVVGGSAARAARAEGRKIEAEQAGIKAGIDRRIEEATDAWYEPGGPLGEVEAEVERILNDPGAPLDEGLTEEELSEGLRVSDNTVPFEVDIESLKPAVAKAVQFNRDELGRLRRTYDPTTTDPAERQRVLRRAVGRMVSMVEAHIDEFGETDPTFTGIGWYSLAIQKMEELSTLIHPELAADDHATFFKILLAVTSPEVDPNVNFDAAMDIYTAWKEGGYNRLPEVPPTGTLTVDGQQKLAWTHDQPKSGIAMLNRLLADLGSIKAVNEWLTTEHPVGVTGKAQPGELRYYGNVAGKSGETKMGYAALGPKRGEFFSALRGERGHVFDLWFTRTWNRAFGTGVTTDAEGNTVEVRGPRNEAERANMRIALQRAADKLGMNPEDVQAVLWYAEQHKWGDNPTDYGSAAKRNIEQRNLERVFRNVTGAPAAGEEAQGVGATGEATGAGGGGVQGPQVAQVLASTSAREPMSPAEAAAQRDSEITVEVRQHVDVVIESLNDWANGDVTLEATQPAIGAWTEGDAGNRGEASFVINVTLNPELDSKEQWRLLKYVGAVVGAELNQTGITIVAGNPKGKDLYHRVTFSAPAEEIAEGALAAGLPGLTLTDTPDGGSVLQFWDSKRTHTLALLDFLGRNDDVIENYEFTEVRGEEIAGKRVGYDRDKAQKTYQRFRRGVESGRGAPKIPTASGRVRDHLAPAEQQAPLDLVEEAGPSYADADSDTVRQALRDELEQAGHDVYSVGDQLPITGTHQLAVGITESFAEDRVADLRGRKVESAQDLAAAAHILRSPRFETLRVIYVKDGVIVGQHDMTSRLPDRVNIKSFGTGSDIRSRISDGMAATGADGFYLMHNHPSGVPQHSPTDDALTQAVEEYSRGDGISGQSIKFHGHVILNHAQFGWYDPDSGEWSLQDNPAGQGPDPALSPSLDHPLLGTALTSPDDVWSAASVLNESEDIVTIFFMDSKMHIRAIEAVSVDAYNSGDLGDWVTARARALGAKGVLVAANNEQATGHERVAAVQQDLIIGVVVLGRASTVTRSATFERLKSQADKRGIQSERVLAAEPNWTFPPDEDEAGATLPAEQTEEGATRRVWQMTDIEFVAAAEAGRVHQATGIPTPGKPTEADTPISIGEREGYSANDIAAFYAKRRGVFQKGIHDSEFFVRAQRAHRELVEDAILEGYPVPAEVLADYEAGPIVEEAGPTYDGSKPKIYFNFDRIKTAEDIKEALAETLDKDADAINAKRGGETVTHEETERLAEELNLTAEDLEARRGKGQNALTGPEAVAYRKMLVASVEHLVKLAKIASSPHSSDIDVYNFERMRGIHYALQSEVMAAQTETARGLNAFAIDVESDIERRQALDALINQEGGDVDSREFAKRLAQIADTSGNAGVNVAVRKSFAANFRDIFFEVWINGLLSAPVTHIVNLTSNLLTAVWAIPERALMGVISQHITGGDARAAEARAMFWGALQGAREGWVLAGKALRTGKSHFGMSKLELRDTEALRAANLGLDPAAISGKGVDMLGKAVRFSGRMLVAGDDYFKAVAYRQELHALAYRQAASEGLEGDADAMAARMAEIMADPPAKMKVASQNFAAYQTYTNKLGKKGQQFQTLMGGEGWGILGTLVMPFKRTPINITKYAFQRTPLAAGSAAVRADIKAGGNRAAQAWARIGLGSSALATSATLVAAGLLTGGGPPDKDLRKFLRDQGWRPYSLKVGGRYYRYNRLDPLGLLIGMGADLGEIIQFAGEPDSEELMSGMLFSYFRAMGERPYVMGLAEAFTAMTGDETWERERFLQRFAGTLIPFSTLVAHTERAIDPEMREIRGTSDEIVPDAQRDFLQSLLNSAWERTPLASGGLSERRDIWGEPMSYSSGLGWIYDFLSPIAVSKDEPDAVSQMFVDNHVGLELPRAAIGHVKLTGEEHSRYTELAGKMAKQKLEEQLAGGKFKKLTTGAGSQTSEQLMHTVNMARAQAKELVKKEFPGLKARIDARQARLQAALMGE